MYSRIMHSHPISLLCLALAIACVVSDGILSKNRVNFFFLGGQCIHESCTHTPSPSPLLSSRDRVCCFRRNSLFRDAPPRCLRLVDTGRLRPPVRCTIIVVFDDDQCIPTGLTPFRDGLRVNPYLMMLHVSLLGQPLFQTPPPRRLHWWMQDSSDHQYDILLYHLDIKTNLVFMFVSWFI